MLTDIQIQNLGCFDESNYSVKFNKLNVLVGPNNSGKSTIFKGLNLTRDYSRQSQVQWNSLYYQMIDFGSAVYNHDERRQIAIDVGYQYQNSNYKSIVRVSNVGVQIEI